MLYRGERRYVTIAHIPKATIQAVFGALPLATFAARGQTELLDSGHTLLVMAALAIVATAPIGAVLLDRLGSELLPGEAVDEETSGTSLKSPATVSKSGS